MKRKKSIFINFFINNFINKSKINTKLTLNIKINFFSVKLLKKEHFTSISKKIYY